VVVHNIVTNVCVVALRFLQFLCNLHHIGYNSSQQGLLTNEKAIEKIPREGYTLIYARWDHRKKLVVSSKLAERFGKKNRCDVKTLAKNQWKNL